jgi:transposase-like protein
MGSRRVYEDEFKEQAVRIVLESAERSEAPLYPAG